MKIIFLVGLPGSGKTYLGKQLESDTSLFIDDISISNDGLTSLINAINSNNYKTIIVADVFLCKHFERILAFSFLRYINYSGDIEWIFFENDPEKCLKNVEKRADGRKVERLIMELSKKYTIPVNSEVKEIK